MEKQEIIDLLDQVLPETKTITESFFLDDKTWGEMTERQKEILKDILLKEIKDLWK